MTNIILRKGFSTLPSIAALVILGGGLSVNAQTVEPETVKTSSAMLSPCSKKAAGDTEPSNQIAKADIEVTEAAIDGNNAESSNQIAKADIEVTEAAIDGNNAESSNQIAKADIEVTEAAIDSNNAEPSNQVAQLPIGIGRGTRGGSSYIGAGLNIGASGGSSGLGDGNFSIISKIGVTRSFSVRPSVILSNETTFLIPVTYDFSFKSPTPFTEPLGVAPYLGVGAVIKSGDNSETAVLVTGGVDVPLNSRLTATAAVNAGFFEQTDVGFLLGVGYNFRGF
jgi:hypothetical protein